MNEDIRDKEDKIKSSLDKSQFAIKVDNDPTAYGKKLFFKNSPC